MNENKQKFNNYEPREFEQKVDIEQTEYISLEFTITWRKLGMIFQSFI